MSFTNSSTEPSSSFWPCSSSRCCSCSLMRVSSIGCATATRARGAETGASGSGGLGLEPDARRHARMHTPARRECLHQHEAIAARFERVARHRALVEPGVPLVADLHAYTAVLALRAEQHGLVRIARAVANRVGHELAREQLHHAAHVRVHLVQLVQRVTGSRNRLRRREQQTPYPCHSLAIPIAGYPTHPR